MNRLIKLSMLLMVVALVSCGDDDSDGGNGTLNITFKANYGDNPLVLNSQDETYFNGTTINLSKLNAYISAPTLTSTSSSLELQDILYLDFAESNRTLEGATEGLVYTYDLEPGSYDGISLGLGVSPDLNAMLPSDFPLDHPLSQAGQYWTAWNSFIFSKTEGRSDADGDGMFEGGFAYHIGSDAMYREKNQSMNIEIKTDKVTTVEVVIDYERVLGTSQEYIDIQKFPAFHSPQDPTLAALTALLASNFEAAVTVGKK